MTDWNDAEQVRAYRKTYNARYRVEHKDKCKAAQKRWASCNREHLREKRAEWVENNRPHLNELQRRSYRKHREKRLADCKAWRKKNREACNAASKAWTQKNHDKRLAIQGVYRKRHRDRLLRKNAAYGRKFPERKNGSRLRNQEKTRMQARAWARTRRARIEANGGQLTEQQWYEIRARQKFCCAMCGECVALTKDHIIPLVAGGSSDASNMQGLCWPCNAFKATRTMEEIAVRRTA